MNAINIDGLGKAYARYSRHWLRLLEWVDPLNRIQHETYWVLKNLNLQIKSGEAVAIIGMNGAGKSTLLKLIAKTLQPSVGTIKVHGSVAALLELGMGFHPDFTGRENVKMAAQLLGIESQELALLMPYIESFADIGEFIDQPFRIYSSGMQVRLAFSIATAKRPDILIVDEALAVGDSTFQQKSFSRIRSFCQQGTTLLLVSHDQSMISKLCDRVILLEKGNILLDGKPEPIFDFFNSLLARRNTAAAVFKENQKSSGKRFLSIQLGEGALRAEVQLCNALDMTPIHTVAIGQSIAVRFFFPNFLGLEKIIVAFEIKNRFGKVVFGTNSLNSEFSKNVNKTTGKDKSENFNDWYFVFNMNLSKGQYSISIALVDNHKKLADRALWQELVIYFEVVNLGLPHFEGYAWLNPKLTIR